MRGGCGAIVSSRQHSAQINQLLDTFATDLEQYLDLSALLETAR